MKKSKKVKEKKATKEEVAVEEKVETPDAVDPEVEEKVNELSEFVRIAKKWGIRRMRHAYHMLRDAEKLLEK